MELIKEKTIDFKYKDVVFKIKANTTAYDIFQLQTSPSYSNGTVTLNSNEYYNLILKNFIVGWSGVTEDAKEVPYSWDLFVKRFPRDNEVFLSLLNFINEKTDFLGIGNKAEKKN